MVVEMVCVCVCMQHAVGYVAGDEYYGARASINVWAPKVSTPTEFSLSQIWVIGGTFGNDLNTIEAGWQVHLRFEHHPFPLWSLLSVSDGRDNNNNL